MFSVRTARGVSLSSSNGPPQHQSLAASQQPAAHAMLASVAQEVEDETDMLFGAESVDVARQVTKSLADFKHAMQLAKAQSQETTTPPFTSDDIIHAETTDQNAGHAPLVAESDVQKQLQQQQTSPERVASLPVNPKTLPPRADTQEKRQLVRELQQLAVRATAVEREAYSGLFVKLVDAPRGSGSLEDIFEQHRISLAQETSRIAQNITRLKGSVGAFQTSLRTIARTPNFITALRTSMESIEQSISSFKRQQREVYDVLLQDEKTAMKEIEAFERRFEAWANEPSAPSSTNVPPSRRPLAKPAHLDNADAPIEVADFERYVAEHGGLTGGWDDYDHGTFLRHRNRLAGKLAFIDAVKEALPTRSEDEIRLHELWFAEFLVLQEKKRQAIANWKETKRALDEARRDQVEATKAAAEELARNGSASSAKQREEEAAKKKRDVELWRLQQQAAEKEALQSQQEAIQRRNEQERLIQQEKRAKAREQIQALAERRAEEERETARRRAAAQAEEISRRKAAEAELVHFRERDQRSIAERAERAAKADEEARARAERLEKLRKTVAVTAASDPSRLLRPTASTRNREADETPSGGRVYARAPPRLAVPSWRQGL